MRTPHLEAQASQRTCGLRVSPTFDQQRLLQGLLPAITDDVNTPAVLVHRPNPWTCCWQPSGLSSAIQMSPLGGAQPQRVARLQGNMMAPQGINMATPDTSALS